MLQNAIDKLGLGVHIVCADVIVIIAALKARLFNTHINHGFGMMLDNNVQCFITLNCRAKESVYPCWMVPKKEQDSNSMVM